MALKAVVTGHLGFVGRYLSLALNGLGYEVIGLDLKNGQDIDICYLPDADKVFHLAAQTDAQFTQAHWDAKTNIMASLRIFEYYRDRVVFASSSMVNYPVTPYAISKRAAEDYARYFGCAVVRFCNLYGENGHSVIDKFREQDTLTIFGSGEQMRTYAPVEKAVHAMITVPPGQNVVLHGDDYTVNEIADMFPGKPIDHVKAGKLDIMDGRQRLGQ